jgi:signal transduction histidine kinase
METTFRSLQNLTKAIELHHEWMLAINISFDGKIKSWNGFPEKFGFSNVNKSASIEEVHPVFSKLFPIKESGLFLPRIQTELNRFINIYIYTNKNGYLVFIEDSTYEANIVKESYNQVQPHSITICNPFNKEALSVFNCSVLQHFEGSKYYPLGLQPDWFYKIFPLTIKVNELVDTKKLSMFLESFLSENIDVIKDIKTKHSDVWIEISEDEKEYFLQATMLLYKNETYVFIKNLTEYFDDQQSLLQKSREKALDYERLEKTEAQLKKLVRFKEQFVSIVSHDFRGPISGIAGLIDILLNDNIFNENNSEEHIDILSLIHKDLERLIDYIQKLYNWSNLSNSNFKPVKITLNLSELISRNLKQFAKRFDNKSLKLITNLDKNIFVPVDDSLFTQALNNLFDNAIKFTPENKSISVSLAKKGNKTVIKIADSGIGIKEKIQSKIFNEYVEDHTLGTKGERGSGLGLSIVKMIIEAHGFDINFTSANNEGTEFVITMEE